MAKKHGKTRKIWTVLGTLRALKVNKPLTNFIAGKKLKGIKRG